MSASVFSLAAAVGRPFAYVSGSRAPHVPFGFWERGGNSFPENGSLSGTSYHIRRRFFESALFSYGSRISVPAVSFRGPGRRQPSGASFPVGSCLFCREGGDRFFSPSPGRAGDNCSFGGLERREKAGNKGPDRYGKQACRPFDRASCIGGGGGGLPSAVRRTGYRGRLSFDSIPFHRRERFPERPLAGPYGPKGQRGKNTVGGQRPCVDCPEGRDACF